MANFKTAPLPEERATEIDFELERKLDHAKAADLENRRKRIMGLLEAEEGSGEQRLVDFLMSLTPTQRDELKEARLGEFLDPQGEEHLRLRELVHLRESLKRLKKSELSKNDQIAADQIGFIEEVLDRVEDELAIFATRAGSAKRLEQVEKSPQILIQLLTNLEGVKASTVKAVEAKNWDKVNAFNAEAMRLVQKIQELLDVVADLEPDQLVQMAHEIGSKDASKAGATEQIMLMYLRTHPVKFSKTGLTNLGAQALVSQNRRQRQGGVPDSSEKLYEAAKVTGVRLNAPQFLKELASGLGGIPERRVDAALEAAFPKPARKMSPGGKPVDFIRGRDRRAQA